MAYCRDGVSDGPFKVHAGSGSDNYDLCCNTFRGNDHVCIDRAPFHANQVLICGNATILTRGFIFPDDLIRVPNLPDRRPGKGLYVTGSKTG
jgi:hypothetical protein